MGKLALTGGTPLVDSPLGVTWPVYDERDERALHERVAEPGLDTF